MRVLWIFSAMRARVGLGIKLMPNRGILQASILLECHSCLENENTFCFYNDAIYICSL